MTDWEKDEDYARYAAGPGNYKTAARDGVDTRLDEIEQRAAVATPGPWVNDCHSHRVSKCRCLSCYQTATVWQPGGLFCEDVSRDESNVEDEGDRCDQFGYSFADAEFIAHARADVPALVAEVRALRDENERLRARLADVCCAECRNGTDEKLRAEEASK